MTPKPFRIALMSDLHNEFEPPSSPSGAWFALNTARKKIDKHPKVGPLLDGLAKADLDLVVLAGDIDIGKQGFVYAEKVAAFLGVPVVYIAGNHEAYKRDLGGTVDDLRELSLTNADAHFLENDELVLEKDGRRLHVLGCTRWTDYEVNSKEEKKISGAMHQASRQLNDHQLVRYGLKMLEPFDLRNIHFESRAWLDHEVSRIRADEGEDALILIVTHHAPVPEANGEFVCGDLSPAYASDLTAEIEKWHPNAWCFGHTHIDFDRTYGRTRVLSSQRGYTGHEEGADKYEPLVFTLGSSTEAYSLDNAPGEILDELREGFEELSRRDQD
ncbi:metallophosphoesterase [Parvibaculum sp.]|nr:MULTISPECIES: metallophosphoesterase [Parvibaculum]